jgi:hypothetical protein
MKIVVAHSLYFYYIGSTVKILKTKSGHEIMLDDADLDRVAAFNWYVQKVPGKLNKLFRWINKKCGARMWLHGFILGAHGEPIRNKSGVWTDYRKENLEVIRRKPKPIKKAPMSKEAAYLHHLEICRAGSKRRYYARHKPRMDTDSEYRAKINERARKCKAALRKKSLNFRISQLIRGNISHAVRVYKLHKTCRSMEYLGCPLWFYADYLAGQFTEEMSWGNHGTVWEIDHIRPIALFDLRDQEQALKAFNYANTRPLLKKLNRSSGSTVRRPFEYK